MTQRAIKFRGWDPEREEWVYGYYSAFGETAFIIEPGRLGIPEQRIQVIPESVGQFTGLHDKNGKKEVYGGDVVRSDQWIPGVYQVSFDRGAFYLADSERNEVADIKYVEGFEVIGNVMENPELLQP